MKYSDSLVLTITAKLTTTTKKSTAVVILSDFLKSDYTQILEPCLASVSTPWLIY